MARILEYSLQLRIWRRSLARIAEWPKNGMAVCGAPTLSMCARVIAKVAKTEDKTAEVHQIKLFLNACSLIETFQQKRFSHSFTQWIFIVFSCKLENNASF